MINTKKVTGRRKVRYELLDDFLSDAEQFATGDVKELGNWSPGQIYSHLAKTMDGSIDGFSMLMPAPLRMMLTLFMKRKFLHTAIPAGFKTAPDFVPPPTSNEDGLTLLRNANERLKQEPNRAMHPGFGKISREEWDLFHLRHAEMHMSFLVKK